MRRVFFSEELGSTQKVDPRIFDLFSQRPKLLFFPEFDVVNETQSLRRGVLAEDEMFTFIFEMVNNMETVTPTSVRDLTM